MSLVRYSMSSAGAAAQVVRLLQEFCGRLVAVAAYWWGIGAGMAQPDDSRGKQVLQYELYVPAGWMRMRRQKGSIALPPQPDAFATVAISMAAASAGRVPTPTLVVLPPGLPPVRGGTAWVDVHE
jgi:hypothetical protein